MAIVKRISPGSAFTMGLVMYAFIGFLVGVVVFLIALAGGSMLSSGTGTQLPFTGATLGVVALIVCPIIYGIIGGIAAVIGALIYNLAAGIVGGLSVDIN